MDFGAIPDWLALTLQLAAAFTGGSVGVSAMGVHRTRTDDRRQILIDLLPALYAAEPTEDHPPRPHDEWLDAGLPVLNATQNISTIVGLLPWSDRAAWLPARDLLEASGIGPVPEWGHQHEDLHVTYFAEHTVAALEVFENQLRDRVNPTPISRIRLRIYSTMLFVKRPPWSREARESRISLLARNASNWRQFYIEQSRPDPFADWE